MVSLMHPWQRRALSPGEIALGHGMFKESIDWTRIAILQTPPLGFGAMVPFGKTIVFATWRAPHDFAQAPLSEQSWFVHELMHVAQAKRGTLLAAAKLGALGRGAYAYTPHTNAKLADYNIERQAEIARHLFLARAGQPAPDAPDRAWLESVWSTR